ncbi:MAG TPA: DUF2935 domain-containing protein [Metabacillus sp.]|nr:DUF2935 domain-containing protein [Metabacillus sp.]
MTTNLIPVWDEHLFWLEVLQDHAYFVRDHLSVSEAEYVNTAQQYIQLFGELISMLNSIPRTVQHKSEGLQFYFVYTLKRRVSNYSTFLC